MVRAVSKKRRPKIAARKRLIAAMKAEHDGYPPCTYRFEGCTGLAIDPNEVLMRSRGGSIVTRENIRFACRNCHDHFHAHPKEMHELGLMPHSWDAR